VGDDNDNDNEHENTGIKLQGEGGSRPIGLLNPSAGLASSQPLVDPKVDQSPARIAAYLETLADETGGEAFVITNNITGAIRQAVEDSAATYTLGFYIDRPSIDGKFHELKVEVKRKGVKVRYPKAYLALEDTPATKDQRRNSLLTAVRSPIESSAIPVQVRVERVEKPLPHWLSIFGSIDIHSVQVLQNSGVRKVALDVVTIEQDQSGKVIPLSQIK